MRSLLISFFLLAAMPAGATVITFDLTSLPSGIEYWSQIDGSTNAANSTYAWWSIGDFEFEVAGTVNSPNNVACSNGAVVCMGGAGMFFAVDATFSIRRTGTYSGEYDEYPNTFNLMNFTAGDFFGDPNNFNVTSHYYEPFYGELTEQTTFAITSSNTSTTYANNGAVADYMTALSFEHESNTSRLVLSSVTVSAVPIPAAAWLFGSALAGLGWIRRKQTA